PRPGAPVLRGRSHLVSGMEDLYQQVIIDHSRERHGLGLMDGADGESFQLNPTCGDEIRLQVRRAGHTLAEVWLQGRRCSSSQASASGLSVLVAGASTAGALALADTFRALMHARREPLTDDTLAALGDGAAFAGVARYPARVKCAML